MSHTCTHTRPGSDARIGAGYSRGSPRHIAHVALLLVTVGLQLLASPDSVAQPAAAPTPGAPVVKLPGTADLERARAALPTAAELEQARRAQENAVTVRPPAAALDPKVQGSVDLSRLAEQYEQIRRGPSDTGQERQASGLIVFVSLGLPRPTLERLVADAERVRATLVLRGVRDRSVTKTAKIIAELIGKRAVSWQIDPALFTRFEVRAVPTFVLIDPSKPILVACNTGQCQQAAYAKVAGDVSIGHALGAIEELDRTLAGTAKAMGARLQGGGQ
jgi:conjugal transfer pilus assembly protein TrbC